MILGAVSTQFLDCPLPCEYFVWFENLDTGQQAVAVVNNMTGAYNISMDEFNYNGSRVRIRILGCGDPQVPLIERPVLYDNVFFFPAAPDGQPRYWQNLDFIVRDPLAEECAAPPREVGGVFCSFYLIYDPCSGRVCVYNTQNTGYSRITYFMGDGSQRVGDNVCYVYSSFGQFIVRQRVERLLNGVVVSVCEQEVGVEVFSMLPDVSLTPEYDTCCQEPCVKLPQLCVYAGDCVRLVPSYRLNDRGCCVLVAVRRDAPPWGQVPWDPQLQCQGPLGQRCARMLYIRNYGTEGNQGPVWGENETARYVEMPYGTFMDVGVGQWTMEFLLARNPGSLQWVEPEGNFPLDAPRVLFSWQPDNQVCEVAGTVKTEMVVEYTVDNRVLFTWRQLCPVVNEMMVATVPNVWAQFPGDGPVRLFIVKGNLPNSNSRLNYRIYVNGVDVTDPNLFLDNLPVGVDTTSTIQGSMVLGAMWHRLSMEKEAVMADPDFPIEAGEGIAHNYGNFGISVFRFYGRGVLQGEMQALSQSACMTDPIDRTRLLLDARFDVLAGETAEERLRAHPVLLRNFLDPEVGVWDEEAEDNTSLWRPFCCTSLAFLRITYPDGTVEELPWEAAGYFCFQQEGEYVFTLTVCNCCKCCESVLRVRVGSPLLLERLSCNAFRLIDTYSYTQPYTLLMTVWNVDGQRVMEQRYDAYRGDMEFELTLPGDGMYLWEYKLVDAQQQVVVWRRHLVVDFCNVVRCYSRLLQGINCGNCERCWEEVMAKQVTSDTLNLLLFNVMGLLYNLFTHVGLTQGTLLYDDQYLTFFKEGQYYIEQLMRICGDCGYLPSGRMPLRCLPKPRTPCCLGTASSS